jgi:hypothetical protein
MNSHLHPLASRRFNPDDEIRFGAAWHPNLACGLNLWLS